MGKNPHLEEINEDLEEFVTHCKQNNLSNEKIAQISKDLSDSMISYQNRRRFCVIGVSISVFISLYSITSNPTYSHLAAIGRIAIIKVLPLWDWTYLANKKCLIHSRYNNEEKESKIEFDCNLCESLPRLDVHYEMNDTYLKEHYMDLHKPVILIDKLWNWPIFRNPDWSTIQNGVFDQSYPCHLSTNVYNGMTNIGTILKNLKKFDEFFLHFQNCELRGVKAFRPFAPKFDIMPVGVSPTQYSWVLINQNYNVTTYKSIPLTETITVIGQVKGSTFIKIVPRENCKTICPRLSFELERGETLILTSLWDLTYKTNPKGENLAVILEMH